MLDLDDLRLFSLLSHVPSLAAAARTLDVTPPAITVRLQRIENKLGTQLVVRSSRHFTLTEAGRGLAEESLALLQQISAVGQRVGHAAQGLGGPLRIAAPFGFGRRHVSPLVQSFVEQHPEVGATLLLSENPLRDHPDVDVVIHIGRLKDSRLVGHKLQRNERWVCASPGYVERHGTPRSPEDLVRHRCLGLHENDDAGSQWLLRRGRAKPTAVRIRPVMSTNDGDVLCQWAESDMGIAVRSQWDAAPRIAAGRLLRLLPGWTGEEADVFALVHTQQGLARRVTAFIEHARAQMRLGQSG